MLTVACWLAPAERETSAITVALVGYVTLAAITVARSRRAGGARARLIVAVVPALALGIVLPKNVLGSSTLFSTSVWMANDGTAVPLIKVVRIERELQPRRHALDQAISTILILANQRWNRVERVEQEVRDGHGSRATTGAPPCSYHENDVRDCASYRGHGHGYRKHGDPVLAKWARAVWQPTQPDWASGGDFIARHSAAPSKNSAARS